MIQGPLLGRRVASVVSAEGEKSISRSAQMVETYLGHTHQHLPQFIVTVYHHSIIRLVEKGRRAVDIIQRGHRPAFASRFAAQLGGVRHQNEQHLVLHGKIGELVEDATDVLRFRLPVGNLMLEAVEGVHHQHLHSFPAHQLGGNAEHTLYREVLFRHNGEDTLCQVTDGLSGFRQRHPLVFETLAHHAAYQLAVVIGQRGILRAEIAHLPIVAQEQAHGNFVHKLAFSATGNACDREHKTTLELDQPVQILQSRIGSLRHSVVINIHQRIPFVHGAEDSFQRDFRRLLHLLAEPRKIVLQQILVGILAAFPPGHHLAAVHAQAAHQFIAQLHSALVGIHGQDDFRLVIEVRLHEAVQPLKVRASGSVGYGHHLFQSCGYQAEGIYLAFGDVALFLPFYGVYVPRNQLGSFHHLEMLCGIPEFHVFHYSVLQVREADAGFLLAGLRQEFQAFLYLHPCQDVHRNTSSADHVFHHFSIHNLFVFINYRAYVMYRRLQGDVRLALRRVMVLRCCIVVLRRVTVLRCCIVVLRRVAVLRCCIVVLRRVAVLRCILLLFLPFPVLLFLFSFPHLVLVPRYGEITMKAFRPSPFTGDMHTERRIFGIASRCGTFGTRHTEMVLSARQAFQPPHIICMFFARHIQLCFRLSQVARPLGRGGASAGRGTPQYERSPVSGLYVS